MSAPARDHKLQPEHSCPICRHNLREALADIQIMAPHSSEPHYQALFQRARAIGDAIRGVEAERDEAKRLLRGYESAVALLEALGERGCVDAIREYVRLEGEREQ